MRARFEIWTENLKWDWCISRQRYFGVPFPFWYSKRAGEEGRILAAHPDDLPVNPLTDAPRGYRLDEVVPDPDVMDTWATSSVSPQINSGSISAEHMLDAARHAKLFPADLRPQAHEIIRTWAFYTIVKSYLHEGKVPWSDMAISGWCLAQDRSKMSKSKNNNIDPRGLLKVYGADVVRYWTSTYKLGLDTAYSEDVLKVGKRLQTKLWNAARFAMLQLGFRGHAHHAGGGCRRRPDREPFDRWVLSRLGRTIERATKSFEDYEFADALEAIERFFWNDLCDNYLELVKARSYGESGTAAGKTSAHYTLWHCLETVLRLLAPFMPHLTEELYQQHFPARAKALGSIHANGAWPVLADQAIDAAAEALGAAGVGILGAVRKYKSELKVSIKTPVTRLVVAAAADAVAGIERTFADLAPTVSAAGIEQAAALSGETVTTEDGIFTLAIELGESGKAA
jgi:valyl-tRNA synthetase